MKNMIAAFLASLPFFAQGIAAATDIPCTADGAGRKSPAGNVVVENSRFRLVIGGDAIVKSLVSKKTGEELLDLRDPTPFFSVTQERPFNNEIKLCHVNARTTYPANRVVRRDGSRLVVGFETAPYEAVVDVKTTDDYVAFELADFVVTEKSYPVCPTTTRPLDFTAPPVEEFRLVQLPVKDRANFGEWLNVQWDGSAAVGVFATSPHAQVGAERRNGYRLMRADALRCVKLRGVSAVVAVDGGDRAILGRVAALERDYGLPRGAENRLSPLSNASIYFATQVTPESIDSHVEWARKGGFRLMEMSYHDFFGASGDYAYNGRYPNGAADVKRKVLDKVRAAGMVPGLHILHTFIGFDSRLVKDGDRRLLLREHFTLAKPLGPDDTEVFVDENTQNAERSPKCRLLKFGREIMGYEGFTSTPPYKFTGVRRGLHATPRSAHDEGVIGGTLWVCEYGGHDIYLKQDSDLQDAIADKVADFWKAGFGFIYFDGSEGVPPPFGYNVPNAQYRIWRKLDPQPFLGEGAAKAHFGWHMLSGANAFDVFAPEAFKAKIDEYPAAEAPLMRCEFTRVNFGWWGFWPPSGNVRGAKTIGVQQDMWEYGTSKAAAWDSPVSVQMNVRDLREHPRSSDIMETMRRWEDVRWRGWLDEAKKKMLREPGREFHLYLNDEGEYELVEWKQIPVGGKAISPGLRAFIFERGGRRVVAYWHTSGRAKYALADGKGTVVEAEGVKYFETGLSPEAAAAAFANSREIRED